VWLAGGVEVDSPKGKVIRWSQPEIALYDDDPIIRMSYPDLVEDGGKYYLTETQKDVARVHEIDSTLLEGLWSQFEDRAPARQGLLLELPPRGEAMPAAVDAPRLPQFVARSHRADHGTEDLRAGFSVDLWVRLRSVVPGQTLVDNRSPDGKGFVLRLAEQNAVEIVLNDGRTESRWQSDPGVIRAGSPHHVAVVVDGGPKIITFVVDGKLSDGGEARQFGWGRFHPSLQSANGGPRLRIGSGLDGEVSRLRIYGRYLRTSEAVAAFRAGP
jgi:hypothetical protein